MSMFGNDCLFSEFQSSCSSDDEEDDSLLRQYKEENATLRKQNEQLRKAVNIFTQPSFIKVKDAAKDGPIAHVLLFNNVTARKHANEIKNFFHEIASRPNLSDDYVLDSPQRSSVPYLPPKLKSYKSKRSSRDERKASKAYVVTNSFQVFSNYFYLDQIGESLSRDEKNESLLPSYERARPDPLDGEVDEADVNKISNKTMRACFNCGMNDHQIKDCPTPKNFKNINQRKMQFQERVNSSPQMGNSRYHADNDSDSERFSEFKPGVISSQLREALGIRDNQLPPYIYQMRWHGYPPGHMIDAKINSAGLNFYSEGRKSDSQDSEGQVDVDKIISYPGFNVPPAPQTVEDPSFPPMDDRHSKDVMVSYHMHKNELLKNKRNNVVPNPRKRQKVSHRVDNVDEVDMEIEDDSDPAEVVAGDARERGDQRIVIESSSVEEEEKEEGECDEMIDVDQYVVGLSQDELQVKKAAIERELGKLLVSDVVVISSDDDVTSNDVTPNDVTTNDVKAHDVTPDDVTTNDVTTNDVTTNDVTPDDVTPDDVTTNDVTPDDVTTNDVTPDDVTTNDVTPDDVTTNDVTPDDVTSDDVKVEGKETLTDDVIHNDVTSDDVTPNNETNTNEKMFAESTTTGHPSSVKDDSPNVDVTQLGKYGHDVTSQVTRGGVANHITGGMASKVDDSNQYDVDYLNNKKCVELRDIDVIIPQKDGTPHCDVITSKTDTVMSQSEQSSHTVQDYDVTNDDKTICDVTESVTMQNDVTNEPQSTTRDDVEGNNDVMDKVNNISLEPCAGNNDDSDVIMDGGSGEGNPENTGVPHRSKFAAGVTQFDAYYRETKSHGVFNKLKRLLRNSPRRQPKD
uniref:zinc finger CCHC domain-containing protein 8 n=1 Tax=Ciona intestinalis TaxID=7719 RepID=UPI000EF4B497|nr:zinc finger CCHC domain-containing protein 8 [Ciona intestinalis]|eukprot:XP_026695140.1 zinc finger CCHC domain-containing protein 8 [Ciona intestinalis]